MIKGVRKLKRNMSGERQDLVFGSRPSAIDEVVEAVNKRLEELLPESGSTPQLRNAMAYSLLAPGKRLRPLLTIFSSMHFGFRDLTALDVACAIEMIHTASLVMDDLPSMDNAMLRRGRPASHRKFGQDVALLTSVALLNQAYAVIAADHRLSTDTRTGLMQLLTDAVGADGLIGGQLLDLKSEPVSDMEVSRINGLKTAALFVASAEAGAVVAGVSGEPRQIFRKFALELGVAFQLADDLLDDAEYAGHTGKDTSKDVDKQTLVTSLGRDGARKQLQNHLDVARKHLASTGSGDARLSSILEYGFARFT
jgi:geranylgeranyl diphosphate synthase, type II